MEEKEPWALDAFPAHQYEAIISELLQRGYRDVFLGEIIGDEPHVFLRHDVDICPERALLLAEREYRLGVCSTYYFLLSTRFYNLASALGRNLLQRICHLGHQVGLHFDATQFDGNDNQIEQEAARECEILEMLIERPVESISFHRPVPKLLNHSGHYAGRLHCYAPEFFSEITYMSDSNGGWYHGHPLEHPAITDRRAMQLLTHPVWWVSEKRDNVYSLLEQFRHEKNLQLQSDLRATVKAYKQLGLQESSATVL